MNHHLRNNLLMFSDTVLFTNAMSFLSVNAVITYFLATLGAGTYEIGLANALVSIGSFVTQPIFAKKVMNLARKQGVFAKILLIQRLFFLLFVVAIPFVAPAHPRLMVYLFLFCWAIFSGFVGSYGPFYMSLFAKLIAVHSRGRLRGYSSGIGNLLALGTASLTAFLLKEVPFPYNYTIIFGLGVLLLLMDVLVFVLMKEITPDQITKVEFNYFQYFKVIPQMFREFKSFKQTVIGFSFMITSQVGLVYYALYAVRSFQADGSDIALFTAITGLANIMGSVVFGILADRFGHRFILIISSSLSGLAGILVIAFSGIWVVYAAFALTNLGLCGYNLSSGIYIIEQIPRERLPMGISINTMITLVVSSIITLGSSFLVDSISFSTIFLIAGLAGLLGGIILFAGGKSVKHTYAEQIQL